MQEFKLSKIGVVMLGVSEMPRSVAFYTEKLGLNLTSRFGGFAFLDGGGITLALSAELMKAAGPGPGAVEVVFSVDHVRQAFDALRSKGVEFKSDPRVIAGPNWGANFRDPDGHILSIFGPE